MTRAPAGALRSRHALVRAAYVALLLAGLVGMHGLAHHRQNGAAATAGGVSLLAASHELAHPLGSVSSAVSLTPTQPCHDVCDASSAALCVALLTATGLLLAAAERLRRHDSVPASDGPTPLPSAPVRGPPDPVRVLCVSRT